jgi:hypothetical protein
MGEALTAFDRRTLDSGPGGQGAIEAMRHGSTAAIGGRCAIEASGHASDVIEARRRLRARLRYSTARTLDRRRGATGTDGPSLHRRTLDSRNERGRHGTRLPLDSRIGAIGGRWRGA